MAVDRRDQRARQRGDRAVRLAAERRRHLAHHDPCQFGARRIVLLRHRLALGQAVIVDRGPQIGVRAGEIEITRDQRGDAVLATRRQRGAQMRRPQSEGPRVDRQHQPVMAAEDIVDRADRITDALGHRTRREPRIAGLGHHFMAAREDQRVQLFATMIGSPAHEPALSRQLSSVQFFN